MGGHALDTLFWLLQSVWRNPPTTKSDFARAHATELAWACSQGFVTTKNVPEPTYGNVWRITPEGLIQMWTYAEQHKEVLNSHAPAETLQEQQDQDSPH